ncbi:ROK family transcriptional regulator [Telmatospirillum sp.]|uniref:ROK family transcriptional regulator n=1 Tax=Telmatospirillum sp. TaxID=2079197 RepID=UPI00283C516B|nr:ROK family transcriptional regulator [Telmatospirillum sp.]MDR3440270.1 ROK family transcriptional regulator [Telmatospirillum sp.]
MLSDRLRPLLTGTELPAAKIVRAMSAAGATTAADLNKATGLARSTISQALAELRDGDLIVEIETRSTGMGRPTMLFTLNPQAGRCAGVLLGLDEIRIAVCDTAHAVLSDRSIPIARDYTPADACAVIAAELSSDCRRLGFEVGELLGVGLAVSAPISPAGVVLAGSILPTWDGVDLASVFGSNLHCPVHADNESNCGALAEMTWGAAIGEPDFVLIKFDLGIGGAIVVNGGVQRGFNGSAAEFGHLTLDPRGALCRCGNRGCLETMAGATQLLKLARDTTGHDVSLDSFICEAIEGHVGYRRLIEDAAAIGGWCLGLIGTALNPPLFVIAGGLARTNELFLDRLVQSYERHTLCKSALLPEGQRARFAVGRFLANDTVLGAVALVLHQQSRIA